MTTTEAGLEKLRAKLAWNESHDFWGIPADLFGPDATDIWDFEMSNYIYFVDHVGTQADLVRGLEVLSPLLDDALETALNMSEAEFPYFKEAVAKERLRANSLIIPGELPERWLRIVLPDGFFQAYMLADTARVPLGCALVRIYEGDW